MVEVSAVSWTKPLHTVIPMLPPLQYNTLLAKQPLQFQIQYRASRRKGCQTHPYEDQTCMGLFLKLACKAQPFGSMQPFLKSAL